MCVSASKSCQNHKLSNPEQQIQKKRFNLHIDSLVVSCSYEGESRGHFGFFSFKFTRQQRLVLFHQVTTNKSSYHQHVQRSTYSSSKYMKNDGLIGFNGQINVLFKIH